MEAAAAERKALIWQNLSTPTPLTLEDSPRLQSQGQMKDASKKLQI